MHNLILKTLFFVVCAGFTPPALAGGRESLPGPYPARVLEVVDGDTVRLRVAVWLGQEIETSVRILGIDAPELRGKCFSERARAVAAREKLKRIFDGQGARVFDIRADKYGGRVLARMETAEGQDVAALLKAQNLVHAYDGGRRDGWC